jgi:soluble lytic murein transglycosylase
LAASRRTEHPRREDDAEDYPPAQVIAWYANHPPRSGNGLIRLGTAMMDSGRRDEGVALIRKGWVQYNFSPFDENQISTTYSNVLGPGA